MKIEISQVVKDLKPSGIRKFFDIANEMEDVVSLGIGEPDFVTPWHIRDVGIYSLEKGHTYYTSNSGILELREEVCVYLKRKFNLEYMPSETIITVGGSEAIDLAIRALITKGDEVLIPEPSFVCYTPCVQLAGGVAVSVPTRVENEFKLTPDDIKDRITDKTKILVLPYPNNPTGAIMTEEDLQKISDILKDTNIVVISDEIYAELTYGEEHTSIANIEGMKERTIVINGFSKAYAMTGWRLGYAAGPFEVISAMTKIHQYAIMSAPTTSQHAAIEALRFGDEDIIKMKEEYNYRRKYILDGLASLGLNSFEPRGAFYIFPCIKRTNMTSNQFCEELLRNEKVALIPGNAFGDTGEGFVRCSYAYSIQTIDKALKRIKTFLDKI